MMVSSFRLESGSLETLADWLCARCDYESEECEEGCCGDEERDGMWDGF
jgi:hypothetical protein